VAGSVVVVVAVVVTVGLVGPVGLAVAAAAVVDDRALVVVGSLVCFVSNF
jgi:hypothetical protein